MQRPHDPPGDPLTLNPAFIGRSAGPSEVHEVTADQIARFAAAVGITDAVSADDPAAHAAVGSTAVTGASAPAVVAPTTFPIAMALTAAQSLLSDPELGLDWTRVVHGEQRFAYSRPIVAGDRLQVTSTIEAITSMAGNDLITIRGDITSTDGTPVVSCWSLLVARGPDA